MNMTKSGLPVFLFVGASFVFGASAFAGEPAGIGEKGTGQTQKSTDRQQSGSKPDMSQVPEEIQEGKSAQAAQELNQQQQGIRGSAQEPAGIGEKGTGQTKKSTERQQSGKQPDMSQVPEELREGKSARAAGEMEQQDKKTQ
ncbi:exported protein of unknown function [Nitrospira japonica]|uniref:Uncharacterized protein n=1 Tax=Nitrospira japonica TaxID=1325564 RepID=A0A1W1I8U8_9BACT|nr:hypothetical protein [Nitrospira japonica]SLM49442.1 exported protein of unknown function [Nitrospira japonica]